MRMEGKKTTMKVSETKDGEGEKLDLSGLYLGSLQTLPNSPSLNLASITKLDLSNNNLEAFPESLTARLLNLQVMDMHSNQLRALPNSIGCLSKLRILNVSGNLLDSLPRSIENCRGLEELIANFNELNRLPDTMGFELINLQKLSVNSNKLSFLPSSTSHMTSLRSLDARLNRLRSLPDGLENLIHLRSLDVSQNFHHLSSLPSSLGLLPSLTDLDVSYNSISALPDSISCLTSLFKLRTQGNPLVHPPPAVAQRGIMAVQEYLRASYKNAAAANTKDGAGRRRRPSWILKLVRCSHHHAFHEGEAEEEFLSSMEVRSSGGLATPRHEGMLSPWRLFSPKRPASTPASPIK